MDIYGRSVLDYPSLEALIHLSMFKKKAPMGRLFFMTTCFLIVVAMDLLLYFTVGSHNIFFCVIIMAVLVLLTMFWIFVLPSIRYKALGNMQGAENHYVFSEHYFTVTSYGAVHEGQSSYDYSMLVKAYETSAYFFFFISQNQVFMVDKASVSGGTVFDLRWRVQSRLGKKYYICKY